MPAAWASAAVRVGDPVEVLEYLGRYRVRYYPHGFALGYEFSVAIEADGLRVELRQLAVEALGDDALQLRRAAEWVVTSTADPDGGVLSVHSTAHAAVDAYRAAIGQAVEPVAGHG